MKTAVRQQRILQELNSRGFVKTSRLAEKYDVSVMTIRRDLLTFSKRGVLTLVRGGAVANRGALAESDYYSKREDMLEAKRNIAQILLILGILSFLMVVQLLVKLLRH